MTTVVVLPNKRNGKSFRAVSGEKESFGKTVGEAIDALTEQFELTERNAVVYIQDLQPDEFFTEVQQKRLAELMGKWRAARDYGKAFSDEEQAELEKLIEAELEGSGQRAKKLADALGK